MMPLRAAHALAAPLLATLALPACTRAPPPAPADAVARARPADEAAILAMPTRGRLDVTRWYNRLWTKKLKAKWAYDCCSRLKHTGAIQNWTGRLSDTAPGRIDIDLDDQLAVTARLAPTATIPDLSTLDPGQPIRFSGALDHHNLDLACGGWDEIGAGSSPLEVRVTKVGAL